MHIPRHWARARVDADGREVTAGDGYTGFGWSDESVADAERHALANARALADRAERGEHAEGSYPYPDRPVREMVLDRDDDAG